MFRPFALAITFSLLASLLVSITVVPALASTFFKNGINIKGNVNEENKLGGISKGYKRVLGWSLNHKWLVLIISIVILIVSIGIGAAKLGTSYISTGEDKFLALTYTPKPGETEEAVLKHAEKLKNTFKVKIKLKQFNFL